MMKGRWERSGGMQHELRIAAAKYARVLLAFVLAAVLAVSQLPVYAFAAGGETQSAGAEQESPAEESTGDEQQADQPEEGEESGAGDEEDGKQPVDGEESDELQTTGGTEADDVQESDRLSTDSNREKQQNEDDNASESQQEKGLSQLRSAAAGASSKAAPRSAGGDELEPGTYTITANLYVGADQAPIGVNVYLGDTNFPPISPQNLNATLVVDDEGGMKLTIPVKQEIFTLQEIGDGEGVHVESVVRGGKIDYMGSAPEVIKYTDRITEITVSLSNTNGTYSFGNCKEYPAILDTDKDWTIHLAVDFEGAVKQVAGDFEQTFTDENAGISFAVKAEEGSSSIAQLQNATLSVSKVSEGENFEAAQRALSNAFTSAPQFTLYDIDLVSDGKSIMLDDKAAATLSIPTDVEGALLYRIDGTAASNTEATLSEGTLTVDETVLGQFAVVDPAGTTAWSGVKTLSGSGDTESVSLTYRTTGFFEYALLYVEFETLDQYGMYNAYFSNVTQGTTYDTSAALVEETGAYEQAEIEGVYALGLDMDMSFAPGANQQHSPMPAFGSMYQTSLSAAVPASNTASVYLVTGTVGEGMTSIEKIDAFVSDGSASFDIAEFGKDMTSSWQSAFTPMWNAASGWDTYYDTMKPDECGWDDSTKLAYIVVASEAPKAVDKPVAATGLVYNGTEQTGVAEGEGYELSVRPTATAAGDYAAQATLKDGYVWSDGTTDPVTLSWSIAPAELTATYAGEEVAANEKPTLGVEVTGFVNGETAKTAAGYSAPTVIAPESLEAGKSYELTPEGGKADNYTFKYVAGTLKVTEAKKALEPGTYTITANLQMPAEYNPILPVAVYPNNPNNPFPDNKGNMPVLDENDASEVANAIPMTPLSMNAQLIVGKDGTKTLVLPIKNPVFTTQDLGTCSELSNVKVERVVASST